MCESAMCSDYRHTHVDQHVKIALENVKISSQC